MLDEADPALLAPCFERLEALLAEPPLRRAFGRLGGRTLVAWDGTEFFCSQKLGCPHCLTRRHSNGKVESGGDGRRARPRQNRASDAGVYRAARRRRKTGLRAKPRRTLVR